MSAIAQKTETETALADKPAARGRGRPRHGSNDGNARQRILDAAATAFTERGFDGVSILDVAKMASVTHPLIHYHFDTKLALWQAVVDHLFAGLPELLLGSPAEMAQEVDDLARIKGMIGRFMAYSARQPALVRFVIHEGMLQGPRLTWLLERYLNPIQAIIREIYQSGRDQGLFKNYDAAHVTHVLAGLTSLTFAQAPLVQGAIGLDPLTPAFAQRHTELITDLLFNGLLLRPGNEPLAHENSST